MTTLIRHVLLLVLAWAGVFAPFESAFAARTINTVTLNGAATVTVAANAAVTVAINVTTDNTGGGNPTRWRSTGWRISTTAPGTVTCVNHTNYDAAGTNNESFNINAPAAAGTYNVYFIAYSDDACSAGASTTRTLTNGMVVVIPLAVTSATLNGAASVTVTPGATISAVVNVTSNSAVAGFQWRSTGWRIDTAAPGTVTCVNHPDRNTAGSYSETFSVTAPNSDGTDNAYFIAYTDDACTTGASATLTMANAVTVPKVVTEINTTGGTNATNGLHFYLEDATKLQVRRLNNTGQVYAPGATPPSTNLDNGIFIRANGLVYGPSHAVTTFAPTGGMYNTYTITPVSPPNPSVAGLQQSATGNFGITGGPQVSVVWKYTLPQDFLIAEVTVTIPGGYPVSVANPVRYYHVFDTYLGGSDNGCGFSNVDAATGKRIVGTYQPSSGTCTSTTTLPAGTNVVESFRERSGPAFSSYCASGWASFFTNGTTNCSVLQTAAMSKALAPTLIDTGMGIEMDFTAAGTYTFSYDFVIGSPTPPYDHLEIQHDGSGTLCPEAVTVLACTVSTVPCPAGNTVSTGALTGTITATGSTSVTATPSPFTVGSAGVTATVALQTAAAGTVTLGASGMSTAPANGVRCYNTTTLTQSCSMSFVNTPCVGDYECQETGTTYYDQTPVTTNRNPLYTKLSGTNFAFDVVALQSNGTQATTYTATSNVTVELFDDTTPAASCSAYASPIATQAITFAASDNGRKTTGNFNLPNAYSKLRCRVTDTNPATDIYGCSSDRFAVRPQLFSITAPVLDNALLTGTPKAVAGTAFTLDANAGVTTGYNGTPVIDTDLVQDHANATIATATLSGSFAAGTGPKASGAAFKYLDVGNLKFLVDAVLDSGFTAIDQTTDCVVGSSSNTLVGGKYGCNIGNAASTTLGRWIPSHYSFYGTLASTCAAGGLSFMDQDAMAVLLTLKAHASTGAAAAATDPVVSRYTAGYNNLAPVTISGDNGGATVAVTRLTNPPFPTMSNTALWTAGQFIINDTFAFSKLAAPDGPYDTFRLKADLTDPDGALLLAAASAQTNTTRVRNGRVRLANAYGSELLDLPVLMRSEYWSAGGWVLNVADVCTNATLTFAAVNAPDITAQTCVWDTGTAPGNSGKACTVPIVVPARQYREVGVSGFAGDFNLWLRAPGAGNRGSIDVTATVPAWLQFNWTGVVGSPKARATFGAYRNPLIYRRENY